MYMYIRVLHFKIHNIAKFEPNLSITSVFGEQSVKAVKVRSELCKKRIDRMNASNALTASNRKRSSQCAGRSAKNSVRL